MREFIHSNSRLYFSFIDDDKSNAARVIMNDKWVDSYKYCSKDTLDHFSFHDCVCSRMFFDGSNIVLNMEWMEVLPSHPNNPYDKAYQSNEGRIVLENASLDKCVLLPWDEKEKQTRELNLDEIDIKDFELLSFDEEEDEDGYKLLLYGEIDNRQGDNGYAFIDMIVRYSSSQDMFNELVSESWFEGEGFKE